MGGLVEINVFRWTTALALIFIYSSSSVRQLLEVVTIWYTCVKLDHTVYEIVASFEDNEQFLRRR